MEIMIMIKLKNLGLVGIGILALLGTVANAQTASMFTQSTNSTEADATADPMVAAVSSAPTVAAELFGSGTGVKLEFGTGFQPIYKLTYVQATELDNQDPPEPQADTDESIETDDEGMITFMLGGAVFAERVSPNDFELTDTAGDADIEVESGGAKGDSSVTIKVTAGDDWDGDNTITFTVPDVTATDRNAWAFVRMSSSYSVAKQSNFPEGAPMNANCDPGFLLPVGIPDRATTTRGCRVVQVASHITSFDVGSASASSIDLADRAKLIGADRKHLADVAIGKVTVAAAAPGSVMGQDGKAASFTGDLSGDLEIMVASSQFGDGDIVYIDDDGNKKPDDSRELFDIDDGMATSDRPLKAGSWTVRYMPNGEDALTHGTTLTVSATTDFSDRENMNARASLKTGTPPKDFDPKRYSVTSTLGLNGIRGSPAKAYAIAPLDSSDTANLRITCESGRGCQAFLSCHDGMGMDYFGDEGIMVPGNGTVRLDQMMISAELGMMEDEGWSGRLSCEVLSTAPISIQVLTRAAGVLVNNTYVGPGG
jgi:hypothetical protein